MKFRKRVKIFPGFYLNISKSGISSTFGVNGASVNFGKKGTYLNTGFPGTGFYNRERIGGESNSSELGNFHDNSFEDKTNVKSQFLVGEIKSEDQNTLTSSSLLELKKTLEEAYHDRNDLLKEIEKIKREIKTAKTNRIIANVFIIGFFVRSFKDKIVEKEDYLADLENQYNNTFIDIDVHFGDSYREKYFSLLNAYKNLLTTEKIWDITSSVQQDMKVARSSASSLVTRSPVIFKFDNIDIIKSSYSAFHFENRNGGDLYIYPAFVIMTTNKKDFALIEIREFELKFSLQKFLEEEKIQSDTKIIDRTWAKVNKDGSPDKRFANNYEIPVVLYGRYDIKTKTGLNESYQFSSFEKSEIFANAFVEYQRLI